MSVKNDFDLIKNLCELIVSNFSSKYDKKWLFIAMPPICILAQTGNFGTIREARHKSTGGHMSTDGGKSTGKLTFTGGLPNR